MKLQNNEENLARNNEILPKIIKKNSPKTVKFSKCEEFCVEMYLKIWFF
jgi:hypothetical protein